jgi:hypothetical protein
MKKCSHCKVKKSLEEFHKNSKTILKLASWCKICVNTYIKEHATEYKEGREKNKDKKKVYNKGYKEKNKNKLKILRKKYITSNRGTVNKSRRLYVSNRKQTDVQFKLSCNLRSRLKSALQGNYKSGSAVRDLGCTIDQFKDWLERQFEPGMDWNNYGNKEGQWSLDHEYPLSEVDLTKREFLLPVIHYTNLQPLWHVDNLLKSNSF